MNVNKIWKLKYQNGTWVVLYHPEQGQFDFLTSEDLANVFKNKPKAEELKTQVWADDLIERYLESGNYSEAKTFLQKYRLPFNQ